MLNHEMMKTMSSVVEIIHRAPPTNTWSRDTHHREVFLGHARIGSQCQGHRQGQQSRSQYDESTILRVEVIHTTTNGSNKHTHAEREQRHRDVVVGHLLLVIRFSPA